MTRIGILGGTFDPIHLGHLRMAEVVREKMQLEKIFLVPTHIPPHKTFSGLASPKERLRMVRLAVKGNPFLSASDFEINRPGKSYSIETVRYFSKRFPGAKIFFIIGADSLATLGEWKDISEILRLARFVVLNRPGDFAKPSAIKYSTVQMQGMDISSSNIRALVKQRKSIRYLVPEAVNQFILKSNLYR